jgi:hypothetical protein
MDLRVARDLPVGRNKVQLIWEAFNLFNRSNFNFANNTYYSVSGTTLTPSTSFATPTGSAGERIMQLAVKFIF